MSVLVDYKKPNFILTFKGNDFKEDLKKVKDLPIREFNKKEKHWKVPQLAVKSLDTRGFEWTEEARKARKFINNALLKLVDYKFAVPEEKSGYLRDYQEIGARFLLTAKKALLADDMGTGKSIQSIEAIIRYGGQRNLIICPATLKWNWENEFKKHYGIQPVVISGPQDKRKDIWNSDEKYLIVNYELLNRDWKMVPIQWDAIIIDEAVYLKSPKAQRTKNIRKLQADLKIGLSGMPIENHVLEFQSIMECIRPEVIIPTEFTYDAGKVKANNRFKYRYCEIGWDGKINGYKNLDELHLLTSPFVLRRKKEDVLKELPPKIYTDIPLELSDNAQKKYKEMKDDFLIWANQVDQKTWIANSLEKIIRLRQFVEFPEILGFYDLDNPKLEWLEELYDNVGKIVVFTYFRDSVNILSKHFNSKFVISGGVNTDERIPIVNEFNDSKEGMFISTDAGRFGINLTECDTMVHFGYWYNPASLMQREDRLHRFGQKSTVMVYKPFIKDTIDEGIIKIFEQRWKDATDFMDGSEEMSIKRLNRADFLAMVSGGK